MDMENVINISNTSTWWHCRTWRLSLTWGRIGKLVEWKGVQFGCEAHPTNLKCGAPTLKASQLLTNLITWVSWNGNVYCSQRVPLAPTSLLFRPAWRQWWEAAPALGAKFILDRSAFLKDSTRTNNTVVFRFCAFSCFWHRRHIISGSSSLSGLNSDHWIRWALIPRSKSRLGANIAVSLDLMFLVLQRDSTRQS